jgi:hypothetical protein
LKKNKCIVRLFKLIERGGDKGMVLFRVCPHISEAERLKWQEIAKGLENILGGESRF